ncbi:hypothetical protein LNAOJCKE_4579 [Methylorubrum aminovorans]|uniref:HTH cro/C1-type domain-containing protein n=1 Tax=Methylorubrum aminovorans TaxID=269069 RepID=A0ABQ4UJD4_9HYPH|nr:hypothetical protein [Methylorubrum aminovorans]GJE67348.1 hypothetical protein LNAOJCKE_4579 [Methylorubrum aminovorans]GMA74405.1 hypothetical protein GCM10025880_08220 [Methylorubrum aminovorans]
MRLIDYMRAERLDDVTMALRVGGITQHCIRKLKYGERGPSLQTAIRIHEVTSGTVGLTEWPKTRVRRAPDAAEPRSVA